MRLVTITIAILLTFAGCSSPKPSYSPDDLHTMFQPKTGMAKLVIYYPESRIWSGKVADVTVQNMESCRLRSGSFMLREVAPGKASVFISLCNGNGITQMNVYAEAGQTYYLQVTPNDKSLSGLIAGYGIPVTENPPEPAPLRVPPKPTDAEIKASEIRKTHAEGTAFNLDRMGEETAMKLLEPLKLAKE